jgi:hypothetical protein
MSDEGIPEHITKEHLLNSLGQIGDWLNVVHRALEHMEVTDTVPRSEILGKGVKPGPVPDVSWRCGKGEGDG